MSAADEPGQLARARDLVRAADALAESGYREEALRLYRKVSERFTGADDPAIRAQVALALLHAAQALEELERDDDAIRAFDELARRFGKDADADVRDSAAHGLLAKALVHYRLDRPADELAAYDDLIERFGDDGDARVRRRLAWALYDKALALERAGRVDEMLDAYGALVEHGGPSDDPEVRKLVGWALALSCIRLDSLGRLDEAASLIELLIHRRDELLDDELADYVAWAMEQRAAALDRSGEQAGRAELLEQLVDRFAEATDPAVVARVGGALRGRTYSLRGEDEIARCEALLERVAASSGVVLRAALARSRRNIAAALDDAGRSADVLRTYDEALASLAGANDADDVEARVAVLLGKGVTLHRLGRDDESVVVLDSAMAAYRGLAREHGPPAAVEVARVVDVALRKLQVLCALDRTDDAGEVPAQVAELLGVALPAPYASPRGDRCSEETLAALLADVQREQWWIQMRRSEPDDATRGWMGVRALELYRVTSPWLPTDEAEWDSVAFAAAILLRTVGNGYAVRSGGWRPANPERVARPTRQLFERALREARVDEWARDLGHPLELGEPTDDPDELPTWPGDGGGSEQSAERFAAEIVRALRTYEVVELLCDSETGRAALATHGLRYVACWRLSDAMSWAAWSTAHVEEAPLAGLVPLMVAEALFLATRGEVAATAGLVPGRDGLRHLLLATGAYDVLAERGVTLPDWAGDGGA